MLFMEVLGAKTFSGSLPVAYVGAVQFLMASVLR